MSLYNRVCWYHHHRGIKKVCCQAIIKMWHRICMKPDIIYFADIGRLESPKSQLADSLYVVERDAANPMTPHEIEMLGGFIYPDLLLRQIHQRFLLGATVWLLKREQECIGMVWSIVGKTVEPFYYFVGPQDVHFFNNEIFEPYRGKGFNPPLIEHVLFQMKNRGYVRACIETNLRNIAEQRSLRKTSFEPVGYSIKICIFNKHITVWQENNFCR